MPRFKTPVNSPSQTGDGMPCTFIRVRARPGAKSLGWLTAGPFRVPCALGPGGISHRTREGSGRTPAGRYRLLAVFYRADRGARPRTPLPTSPIRPDFGWCDTPDDRNYNRFVRHPYPASAECLWRDDRLYDILVVLDHNQCPRKRNFGSAIFLHVAREGLPPTAGCIAVAPVALRRILAWAGGNVVLDIA